VATWGIGINRKSFAIDGATNQLKVPAGQPGLMTYDAAGNLINDTYAATYNAGYTGQGERTYDAENRLLSAVGSNGLTNTYSYDADGRRTRRKLDNSQFTEWWQVYGVGGELVAEYTYGEALKKEYGYRNGQLLVIVDAVNTCQWLVMDGLGTPRMLVDQTGSLGGMKRRDYLPFGEEVLAGMGHRQTSDGYGTFQAQPPRQAFTGKERDGETGLDYFEARYYSSAMGRFTSPDEFTGGPTELFAEVAAHNPTFYADIFDPQSLNKYTYCLNNSFRYLDFDGHQTAQSDRLSNAIDFGTGYVRGIVSSMSYGWVGGPRSDDSLASRAGQSSGTATVLVVGGYSTYAGGGMSLSGGGAVVGVPVMGVGLLGAGGAAKNVLALGATPMQMASKTGKNGDGDKEQKEPVFGEKGTQTTSTTVGKGKGWRIDVENPNPGQRPGQVHYQSGNTKYLYSPTTKSFIGASKSENKRLLSNPEIQKAIEKGLQVLGEG